MAVTQDFNWITKRYPELQRKYPSQYVAIKNRRVIAHGHDAGKVYLKAKRDVKKDFVTAYTTMRRYELQRFDDHVTDWERQEYVEVF